MRRFNLALNCHTYETPILSATTINFLSMVNNFRNSNKKIQYSYLLTPQGIEEKAKLTLDFIRIKTQEYDTLKQEIESLKQEAKNMDRDLL